jgi:1-acyl-sn-glycerol-3-phosphate acyltransferase
VPVDVACGQQQTVLTGFHAGYENVAKAYDCRATLVFNHVSYTDGIMLGAFFLPCGLAKASVADIPFFGAFAKVTSLLQELLRAILMMSYFS